MILQSRFYGLIQLFCRSHALSLYRVWVNGISFIVKHSLGRTFLLDVLSFLDVVNQIEIGDRAEHA